MGNAIPSQHHPAVVLRSRRRVRALLATAIIAAVGLTATVVIAADDDTGAISASPTGQINYGGFNPATGSPDSAPLPQRDAQAPSDTGRSTPEVYVNPSTGYPSTLHDGSPKGGAREVAPPQS
jgi:hypothetical protein